MEKVSNIWKGYFVSREALTEAFENADADVCESFPDGYCDWGFGRENIREVIAGVPAADVEPVRHGKWNIRVSDKRTLCMECSLCGRRVDNISLHRLLIFGEYGEACRRYPNCHCGARMDLEEQNATN